MKLILSGGGDSEQSKGVDTIFTSSLKNNRILYIPIALDPIKHPDEDCLQWVMGNLSPYGNFNITLWNEDRIQNSKYEELLDFGGVFIGGGNTYKLLKFFRGTGFDKYLVKLLRETDIPVIGGSAGALIFAKDIETAELYDDNSVINLQDLSAYDMLDSRNLWVHYEEGMDKDIEEYVDRTGVEVIALPEDSGLFINDGNISVTGKGPAKIFPSGKILKEGENL